MALLWPLWPCRVQRPQHAVPGSQYEPTDGPKGFPLLSLRRFRRRLFITIFVRLLSNLVKFFMPRSKGWRWLVIYASPGILQEVPSPHTRLAPFYTPYYPNERELAKHPPHTRTQPHPRREEKVPYPICSDLDSGAGRPAVRHASPRPIEHATPSLHAPYFFQSKFRSPPTSTPTEPSRDTLARRECKGEYPLFPFHPF